MSEAFEKLAKQLSKLFELEKADLDFGIHRIIKARQGHIRVFLGLEGPPTEDPEAPTLKKIVQREMGELNTVELERQLESTSKKLRDEFGKRAFDDSGTLISVDALESPDGQLWLRLKEELDSGEEKANAQLEAEIYSHLTEFFSRYYDAADFLSKRRIKAGDAPYAVPYSGEEVMLHWANKDQYYIKSSKDLKDYTFTLPDQFGGKRVQFKCERQDPVLNNNNAKREFHLDLDENGNPQIETSEDADGKEALVIGFHFKIVEKTRTQPQTKAWIESLIERLPSDKWRDALRHTPEGAQTNLITRHLNNYTRKNETDFFIHKHLGKFLRGELDFYIKNEVMHLDDIDEKSTDYLTTRVRLIKALRTIAHHIIRFLAQLENFQKKLWLKKKYVTETQYCFTLDRVLSLGEQGQVLLDTLLRHVDDKTRRFDGEMRSQHDEWIKLYAIDELDDYPADGKLTAEFLRIHDKLMLDTVFYPAWFKWQLLGAMDDLEEQLDGLLLHSENFQALNLLRDRHQKKVACVYTDPPYNTGDDGFAYKDRYQSSTWLSMIEKRISEGLQLLSDSGVLFISVGDEEQEHLSTLLRQIYGKKRYFANLIWEKKKKGSYLSGHIARMKDYVLCIAKDLERFNGLVGEVAKETETYPCVNASNAREIRIIPSGIESKYREQDCFLESGSTISAGNMNLILHSNLVIKDGHLAEELRIEGNWRYSQENMRQFALSGELYITQDLYLRRIVTEPRHKRMKDLLPRLGDEGESDFRAYDIDNLNKHGWGTNEDANEELHQLLGEQYAASYPKPSKLITLLLASVRQARGCCLDYFAGSGTTAHAVINLNREDNGSRSYILVEMGDHFDTVLKPRILKVVYSADWKDGKPTSSDSGVSHGLKYLRLESYEDALNNLDLGEDRAPDLLGLGDQVSEDYLFSYLLDVESRGHLLNLDSFRDPWGCELKIHDPHTGKSEARVIDLVETFHYLLGVTVREIRVQGTEDKPDAFLTIEGENPDGEAILIIWRRREANPNVDDRNKIDWPVTDNEDLKVFAATNRGTARGLNPADTEFHAIYINGDHTLPDPNSKIHCIEEVFYERMFANTGNPDD